MDFFPEIAITQGEAELMARGLVAVARADGKMHEREVALVQSFYGEVSESSAMRLRTLEGEPDIAPAVLAGGLSREPVAMLFIKTAVLCAFADGELHPKEKATIDAYAKALGIGGPALDELVQSVKEYLVGQLTGLANVEAAVEVAKKLGV